MTEITIVIKDEHHVSQARIAARELAEKTGFNKVRINEVVTSVSELAGNIYFHTNNGGKIILKFVSNNGKSAIEIIAQDSGPGIPDIDIAMQDGFTTNGGLGGGLPGVNRLMDDFNIKSKPDVGTIITTKKWKKCR